MSIEFRHRGFGWGSINGVGMQMERGEGRKIC